MKNEINLNPLRMIRISKDLTREEMAEYFLVTPAYIGAIENNKRAMTTRTLRSGLNYLNITLDEYESLRNFGNALLQTELSKDKKYAYMLIKTLGIVEKSLKEEAEQSLEKYYYKSGRAR